MLLRRDLLVYLNNMAPSVINMKCDLGALVLQVTLRLHHVNGITVQKGK